MDIIEPQLLIRISPDFCGVGVGDQKLAGAGLGSPPEAAAAQLGCEHEFGCSAENGAL
jgi:hypothetical protein